METVRDGGPVAELAATLLLLGLWPGLRALWLRQRALRSLPDEVAEEIPSHFILVADRLDPQRARRVAATLVRSTERELLKGLRGQRPVSAGPVEPRSSDGVEVDATAPSRIGLPPGLDREAEVAALREWATAIVGSANARLVIDVAVIGKTQREIAARTGWGACRSACW